MRPLARLASLLFASAAVATACSSTTDVGTNGSTTTTTTTNKPNDTALVKYVGLTWPSNSTPCTAPFIITWEVVVDSAKVGDVLVAHVTGPGSPGAVRTTLAADSQDVVTKFTAPAGTGQWTGVVDSVGGKVPRSHLLSVTSTVTCS